MAPVVELDAIRVVAEEQPADAIAVDEVRNSDNRHRLGLVERLRLADDPPATAWCLACRR